MKTFLPVFVVMLLIAVLAGPLQAQPAANPIYLGARAGLNLGNASLTPDPGSGISKGFRTGISGGLFADFGVSSSFFVDAEVLYTQGGVKLSMGSAEQALKIDEVQIPVSAKYKFPMEGSNVKPYVFGGADIGFVAKAEVQNTGVPGSTDTTYDVKDQVESTDYGVHFGAGVELEVSPGVNVFLDGRYGLGLKDIDKGTTSEAKLNNIGILLGVSWKVN